MIRIKNKKIADIGYYINLDSRPDRKLNIDSQLYEFQIFGVERFPALKVGVDGPANCKRSHYELLKKLVESDYNSLLVLEDDCKFLNLIKEQSDEIFDKINHTDFDFFWLGCRNRRNPIFYKNDCYKVSSVSHAQSYIIKKDFAKHILETYPIYPTDSISHIPIDELYCLSIYGEQVVRDPHRLEFYNLEQPLDVLQTKFISLCYELPLTTQYSSYSDLWGFVTDTEEYLITSHPKRKL
jgi:hypothetical protein